MDADSCKLMPIRIDWKEFPPVVECWRCEAPNGWTISAMIPPYRSHAEVVAWPTGRKRDIGDNDYFVFADGKTEATWCDQAEVAARVAEVCRAAPPPAKPRRSP